MAYLIDQLAQRWNTDPERVEAMSYAWREAGFAFMAIEADVEREMRQRRKRG